MSQFNPGDKIIIRTGKTDEYLGKFNGLTGVVSRPPYQHDQRVFITPDEIRPDTGNRAAFFWPQKEVFPHNPSVLENLIDAVQKARAAGMVVEVTVTETKTTTTTL